MPVSIERAELQDAKTLVNVQIVAFHHDSTIYPDIGTGGPPGYDSIAVMQEKITRHESYKIVEDERITGGMVIFVKSEEHYHLDVLFISPEYQNRGIGTIAMRFIEEAYPAKKWTLDTPAWAVRNIHFYEKLRFIKVGEFEDDDTLLFAYEKYISKE